MMMMIISGSAFCRLVPRNYLTTFISMHAEKRKGKIACSFPPVQFARFTHLELESKPHEEHDMGKAKPLFVLKGPKESLTCFLFCYD